MIAPEQPAPNGPFTLTVHRGPREMPVSHFGEPIEALLKLDGKNHCWLALNDTRGGFIQISHGWSSYLVEWRWSARTIRRIHRLACATHPGEQGKRLHISKDGLFPIDECNLLHLGDAFEIMVAFWTGRPRPSRFHWKDRSSDLRKLNRLKRKAQAG